tara:strand:+ start:3707 stop:4864 length:1158 start_codon:yes stop_codon:yes gene_type:complete
METSSISNMEEQLENINPKVLMVGGFPKDGNKIYGGIVTSCQDLINSKFPYGKTIFTIDSTQKSNPIPNFFLRLFYSFIRLSKYLFLLFSKRPNLIILFTSVGASLLEKGVMSWIGFLFRIPVFMFPRGGMIINENKSNFLYSLYMRFIFGGASKILCQGPAWKRFSMNTLKFSDYDTPLIFNWTASKSLLEIGKHKLSRSSLRKENLNILFLGWIQEDKGIFELLDVCKNIKNKKKFKMIFAGSGSSEQKAKNLVKTNNLEEFVAFSGWLNQAQKEKLFYDIDILVLPSWYEGFPNSIVEAMSAGISVISTSVGNIPDILTNDINAILVPSKNKKLLEEAILEILDNEALRKKLAINGYKFASENFSIEIAVNKLNKLIKDTLI